MGEHENLFLQEFEKVLQKQYIKYIISAVIFAAIFIPSTYLSVRMAIANHETRITQCEKDIATKSDQISKLDDKLYNHIAKH